MEPRWWIFSRVRAESLRDRLEEIYDGLLSASGAKVLHPHHAERLVTAANEAYLDLKVVTSEMDQAEASYGRMFHDRQRLLENLDRYKADVKSGADGQWGLALRGIVAGHSSANLPVAGLFCYILWGDDPAIPVYVGQSTNILARLGNHLQDKKKRSLVRRVQLIECESIPAMMALESKLIIEYRPLLNVAGVPVEVSA